MINNAGKDGCTIKLLSLEMENFGCVKKGSFSMDGGGYSALRITGVYGQNGSGKSTLVRTLSFLRLLLCGAGIEDAEKYVRIGEEYASLVAEFSVDTGSANKLFSYSVRITRPRDGQDWAVDEERVVLSDMENLKNKASFSYNSADAANPVTPAAVRNGLMSFLEKHSSLAEGLTTQLFLLMQRDRSRFYKTSYIFGEQLLAVYGGYCAENPESIFDYLKIMSEYALHYCFVITDSFVNGGISRDRTIPVLFPTQKQYSSGALNYFPLSMDGPTKAVESEDGTFSGFISALNRLIVSLSPGTQLVAMEMPGMGRRTAGNSGNAEHYYYIFTEKDGFRIPIKYESLGIKKIISLVNVMALAYVNPSVLLVIDELDSSISEMVLETFLNLFSKSGRGQLVFTANNLYPLEILDKSCCCFTGTNPSDRYVHLKYVKPNNNLRSLYMNLIRQGGDDKNADLFTPLNEENMKRIFEESSGAEQADSNKS